MPARDPPTHVPGPAHASSAAALLVASTVVLAGCIGGLGGLMGDPAGDAGATAADGTWPSPSEVAAYALPRLAQDHDHTDPALHMGHIGFSDPVHVPPREAGAYPAGETYHELAVKDGHAYLTFGPPSAPGLAVGAEAGFIAYDLSDPARPEEVGRWLGQPLGDLEVSDDGAFAFASTQRNGYPYALAVNPDAGAAGHAPRGTYVVDLSDPSDPTTVSFAPLPPNGPHTITYVQAPDGRELLLQSTYDILFTVYPQNLGQSMVTQKVVISEFHRGPGAPWLEPLGTYQVVEPDEGDASFFPHDATAYVDPETERLVMTVAYWELGMHLVDITDPRMPERLASFENTSPSNHTNTHLVRVFPGTIDGRVVAVMEPEIPSGSDDGQFTFVDVTDPTEPFKLGHWSLPGSHVIDKPFIFSPHNFDLACAGQGQPRVTAETYGTPCEDPTVVLSHFHGGLWTLDASDPEDPRPTGFFFPDVERDVPEGFPFTGFFTAFMVDGLVYAPEAWGGLYVLEPGPGMAGPPAGASTDAVEAG